MNYMLLEAVERGTGRNARIEGHMIAGKTGTTNDFRDAWFVGYAPDRVTAVLVQFTFIFESLVRRQLSNLLKWMMRNMGQALCFICGSKS